jgi:hypothetical protein
MMNERPQISEVVNAGQIGLCAGQVNIGERTQQVRLM